MNRLIFGLRSRVRRGWPQQGRESGFTLVEILVTLIACAILIVAVNAAVNTQAILAQRHRDMVIANAYANGKIESLRSQGFLALSDGTTDLTSGLPSELKAPRSATLVISAHNASVKEIDLSITYNDHGNPRTYTYTTLVGELGVGQY